MVCFFFCDFSVGFQLLANLTAHPALAVPHAILGNMIWCFYGPALVLLAMSGPSDAGAPVQASALTTTTSG
jgi:hypothetical protein